MPPTVASGSRREIIFCFWKHVRQVSLSKRKWAAVGDDGEHTESETEAEGVKRVRGDVFFHAPISRQTIQKLIFAIEDARKFALEEADRRVRIFIHSEGGDIYAGLSGMNHIQRYGDITTIADGLVASAGTFLLLGGQIRIAMPDATILIHQLTTEFWGKYADLVDEMKNSKQLMKLIRGLYKRKTILDEKRILKLLKKEITISAKKSLKWGFVDKIGIA